MTVNKTQVSHITYYKLTRSQITLTVNNRHILSKASLTQPTYPLSVSITVHTHTHTHAHTHTHTQVCTCTHTHKHTLSLSHSLIQQSTHITYTKHMHTHTHHACSNSSTSKIYCRILPGKFVSSATFLATPNFNVRRTTCRHNCCKDGGTAKQSVKNPCKNF